MRRFHKKLKGLCGIQDFHSNEGIQKNRRKQGRTLLLTDETTRKSKKRNGKTGYVPIESLNLLNPEPRIAQEAEEWVDTNCAKNGSSLKRWRQRAHIAAG